MTNSLKNQVKLFDLEGNDRILIYKDEWDEMLDSIHFHNLHNLSDLEYESNAFIFSDGTVAMDHFLYKCASEEIEEAHNRFAKLQGGVK